jgi:hypothetical protein
MLDADTDEVAGHAYGTQTSVSLDGETEIVQAMITYELGDGDQILVGGTGAYSDAGGTLTTVRQPDGSYEQTFEFGD